MACRSADSDGRKVAGRKAESQECTNERAG